MRVRIKVLAVFAAGLGTGVTLTAFLAYMTRYSQFDALYGEINPALYLRITQVSSFEKVAIAVGVGMIAVGIVAAAISVRRRRELEA